MKRTSKPGKPKSELRLAMPREIVGEADERTLKAAAVIEEKLILAAEDACSGDHGRQLDGRRSLRIFAEFAAEFLLKASLHSLTNRSNAKKPRRKRGVSAKTKLQMRGLRCAQKYIAGGGVLTADYLCAVLSHHPITYDDDDIELSLEGDNVIIKDLATRAAVKSATIKKKSLRAYLAQARQGPSA